MDPKDDSSGQRSIERRRHPIQCSRSHVHDAWGHKDLNLFSISAPNIESGSIRDLGNRSKTPKWEEMWTRSTQFATKRGERNLYISKTNKEKREDSNLNQEKKRESNLESEMMQSEVKRRARWEDETAMGFGLGRDGALPRFLTG